MMVAVLWVELYLPRAKSLKDKRSILKSLIQKTRHKFKVSVNESDHHELWQSGQIMAAFLVSDKGTGDRMADALIQFIENSVEGEITKVSLEYR